MMRKLVLLLIIFSRAILFSQLEQSDANTFFTLENPRITTDDDGNNYYEVDIYMASDKEFVLGSGQLYFTYNTAAFGENVHSRETPDDDHFEMTRPEGCMIATTFFGGAVPGYHYFIVNNNTDFRISTSFQPAASAGTIGMPVVNETPQHLYSIKFKYIDVTQDPEVAFEVGDVYLDQFFTACGPYDATAYAPADCPNYLPMQIKGDNYDSSGAVLNPIYTWNGNIDSNWMNTENWEGGEIPNTNSNVLIATTINNPTVATDTFVQIHDLTVNASSTLNITSTGTIVVDGDFTNNGTTTITYSNDFKSALIVKGNTSGLINWEYLDFNANAWNLVTAPVNGQSIKNFIENTDNDIRVNTNVNPNRYAIAYFNDANAEGLKWNYYTDNDISDSSLTFDEGTGYIVSRGSEGNLSFKGTINTGDVNKTVDASSWNALGNPYTSLLPINYFDDNILSDITNQLNPSFVSLYTWDATQNKYIAISFASPQTSLGTGQGFLINTASETTEITFKASQRTAANNSPSSKVLSPTPSIELIATTNEASVKTDIKFFELATKGLDPGYDSGNFKGASFDIFTHLVDESSDIDFTIQSLPTDTADNIRIPIGITAEAGTTVTFSVNTENLSGITIYLEDIVNNKITNLLDTNYTITIDESTNDIGQFYIATSAKSLQSNNYTTSNINVFSSTSKQIIVTGIAEPTTIEVYSALGKLIHNTVLTNTNNEISLPKVPVGLYIVKLNQNGIIVTKKIILKP